jgi:hypothetical protein
MEGEKAESLVEEEELHQAARMHCVRRLSHYPTGRAVVSAAAMSLYTGIPIVTLEKHVRAMAHSNGTVSNAMSTSQVVCPE